MIQRKYYWDSVCSGKCPNKQIMIRKKEYKNIYFAILDILHWLVCRKQDGTMNVSVFHSYQKKQVSLLQQSREMQTGVTSDCWIDSVI